MDINQILNQTGAVGAISRELGIDPTTAQAGAAALLPSILAGFKQPAAAEELQPAVEGGEPDGLGGLGGLLSSIGALGGGALLDNVTAAAPTEIDKGNQILGNIFGSKDGSRAIAAQAAATSGIEPSLLKKMLPMLAMAVAGYVMRQAGQGGQGGGLGDIIGGMLGGGQQPQPAPAQGSGNILGDLIGAAGRYLGR